MEHTLLDPPLLLNLLQCQSNPAYYFSRTWENPNTRSKKESLITLKNDKFLRDGGKDRKSIILNNEYESDASIDYSLIDGTKSSRLNRTKKSPHQKKYTDMNISDAIEEWEYRLRTEEFRFACSLLGVSIQKLCNSMNIKFDQSQCLYFLHNLSNLRQAVALDLKR